MSGSEVVHQFVGGISQLQQRLPSFTVECWRKVIVVLLAFVLLYTLAQMAWLLVPSESAAPLPNNIIAPTAPNKAVNVDISRLQSYALFGQSTALPLATANPQVDTRIENATPTRLNLVLQGVMYASDPALASAVIVAGGEAEQYRAGDKLPIAGVSLASVQVDHVIVDNRGSFESLWLYDKSHNAPADPSLSGKAPRGAGVPLAGVSDMAAQYREQLYKNPASLAEAIRIAPVNRAGQMVGYRISPGKDHKQFARFGFQPGDIVTTINGIALDDPSRAIEVYKIMRSAKSASFTVERGNEQLEIAVDIAG